MDACSAVSDKEEKVMPHRMLDMTDRSYSSREQEIQGYAPAIHIPIDDADAALQFCRRLAGLMDAAGEFAPVLGSAGADQLRVVEQRRPKLSVVIPVYNEEENLSNLFARLSVVLEQTGLSYEILFVDDGSRDGSVSILHAHAAADPH